MKVIKDQEHLRKIVSKNLLEISNILVIKYEGLVYNRIQIKGERHVFFYNEYERHLIEIKAPNFVQVSYSLLEKDKDNESNL